MIKKIKGLDINYISYGENNGLELVLLHGWGQKIDMMKPVADPFIKDCHITIIDLPGFGLSEEPTDILKISDYVEIVHELLEELKIKNPVMIGHSFGGKISLLYASKYKTNKLLLFGSPFRQGIKKISLKTKLLKSAKKIPGMGSIAEVMKKHIGSTDYKSASPVMRAIMVDHVNLDITENVKQIKCPTILIWGDMDDAVPLTEAYTLEELISDAAVIVYPGCTHYAYLENLGQTVSILRNFIKE